jgi:hypothetical protein
MILHIMRKDLRLLWKAVILVAGAQAALTLMLLHIDHSETAKNPYGLLLQLILFIAFLGRAVLIVMCVQQDAIPGVNQDWLTRPIGRSDLLLAKVGFVMVFVQGPVVNPAVISCAPNYAPIYPVLIPDGTSRFAANLPFRDPNGLRHYSIHGPDLA